MIARMMVFPVVIFDAVVFNRHDSSTQYLRKLHWRNHEASTGDHSPFRYIRYFVRRGLPMFQVAAKMTTALRLGMLATIVLLVACERSPTPLQLVAPS
jgi:hypothetical protein